MPAKAEWRVRFPLLQGCHEVSQHKCQGVSERPKRELELSSLPADNEATISSCQWRLYGKPGFLLPPGSYKTSPPLLHLGGVRGVAKSQGFYHCPLVMRTSSPHHSVHGDHVKSWNPRPILAVTRRVTPPPTAGCQKMLIGEPALIPLLNISVKYEHSL